MKLIRLSSHTTFLETGCVATIGNFDGVHRGHFALLEQLLKKAKDKQLPSVLILFEPQPREFLDPLQAPRRLTSFREKIALLKQLPIDYVVCLRFNGDLAGLDAEDFIRKILVEKLHVRYLLTGEDFCFGKQRKGNVDFLKEKGRLYGIDADVFKEVAETGERISSTAIRDALMQGDLQKANVLLGRPYSVAGRVKTGAGRGRQWGFPTANIAVDQKRLLLSGVFTAKVNSEFLHEYPAVVNVGVRPTVDGTRMLVEALLLDFDGDLYGQHLEVEFLCKLRDEVKFENVELLLKQIAEDVAAAKAYFNLSF